MPLRFLSQWLYLSNLLNSTPIASFFHWSLKQGNTNTGNLRAQQQHSWHGICTGFFFTAGKDMRKINVLWRSSAFYIFLAIFLTSRNIENLLTINCTLMSPEQDPNINKCQLNLQKKWYRKGIVITMKYVQNTNVKAILDVLQTF